MRLFALFTAMLLFVPFAQAQEGPRTEYQIMLESVERANTRIILFSKSVFDLKLADRLRRTRLDYIRKVKIRVITVPYYNLLGDSAVLSLAVATVPIYEYNVKSGSPFIIVDNIGWKGDRLGLDEDTSLKRMSQKEINDAIKWSKGIVKSTSFITQIEAIDRLEKVIK